MNDGQGFDATRRALRGALVAGLLWAVTACGGGGAETAATGPCGEPVPTTMSDVEPEVLDELTADTAAPIRRAEDVATEPSVEEAPAEGGAATIVAAAAADPCEPDPCLAADSAAADEHAPADGASTEDTATHDTATHDTTTHDTAIDSATHDTATHDTATHDTNVHEPTAETAVAAVIRAAGESTETEAGTETDTEAGTETETETHTETEASEETTADGAAGCGDEATTAPEGETVALETGSDPCAAGTGTEVEAGADDTESATHDTEASGDHAASGDEPTSADDTAAGDHGEEPTAHTAAPFILQAEDSDPAETAAAEEAAEEATGEATEVSAEEAAEPCAPPEPVCVTPAAPVSADGAGDDEATAEAAGEATHDTEASGDHAEDSEETGDTEAAPEDTEASGHSGDAEETAGGHTEAPLEEPTVDTASAVIRQAGDESGDTEAPADTEAGGHGDGTETEVTETTVEEVVCLPYDDDDLSFATRISNQVTRAQAITAVVFEGINDASAEVQEMASALDQMALEDQAAVEAVLAEWDQTITVDDSGMAELDQAAMQVLSVATGVDFDRLWLRIAAGHLALTADYARQAAAAAASPEMQQLATTISSRATERATEMIELLRT